MAAQLIHEIKSTTAYCASRQSMNDGVSAPLAKNFANSIIQQTNSCLTLSAQEATDVLEALKGSAYEEPDKKRIMAVLEAKIRTPQKSQDWWCNEGTGPYKPMGSLHRIRLGCV